jgi:hypothetical protein
LVCCAILTRDFDHTAEVFWANAAIALTLSAQLEDGVEALCSTALFE